MSVDLEAFMFGQLLWSCVLCYCLEVDIAQVINVLRCVNGLERHVLEAGQCQHGGHSWVTPWIESWNWSQGQSIVLESLFDWLRKGASGIHWDGNQVHLTVVDSLLQWTLRSVGSTLSISDDTVTVTHINQSSIIVESIKSGDLCTYASVEQQHDKIILQEKWTLFKLVSLKSCLTLGWESGFFSSLVVFSSFLFWFGPWIQVVFFMSERIFRISLELRLSHSLLLMKEYFLNQGHLKVFTFWECGFFDQFFFFGITEWYRDLISWWVRLSVHQRR